MLCGYLGTQVKVGNFSLKLFKKSTFQYLFKILGHIWLEEPRFNLEPPTWLFLSKRTYRI
jgi:hypothetical protein